MTHRSLLLKKSQFLGLARAALVFCLSLPAALAQTTYTWNSSSGGNWNNTTATGWDTGGGYPTDAGDTAIFSRDLSGNQMITMNVVGTVGNLTLADTGGETPFHWEINGASALTFDSLAGPATLTVNGGTGVYNSSATVLSAPLALNDALSINIQDMGTALALSGALNANNNTITLVGTGALTLGTGAITNLAGLTTGASQRYVVVTGNNTLTGDYVLNLRNLADFAQTGRLDITSGSVTVNADNIGKATISGNISGATDLTINGTGGLNKAPSNLNYYSSVLDKSLVRLAGSNTFSGNTTLNGAGLSLEFNTSNTNKIGAGVLTLNNALFSMTVNSAANSTQTVGSTTITPRSGNQVSIYRANGNLPLAGNLTLGMVTAGAESWTNFQNYASGGTGSLAIQVSNANTNGILGPWATFGTPGFPGANNLTWAAVSGGVVGAATLTSLTTTGISDPTGNYLYEPASAGTTNRGVSTPITGNVTANSLKILITTTNYYNTLSTGANVVTLTSGGLLLTSNGSNGAGSTLPYSLWSMSANDNGTGSVAITGTGLITTSDPATTPLTIVTNRPTWIDNPLVGDSSGRLVKAGWGPLFLSAASTMEGITIVGGEVGLTGNATLPAGNLSLNNGGALMATGTITRTVGTGSGEVSFGAGGGGFAALGSGLTLNLTGSGAGGALTSGDVGNNLVLSNIHAATGVTTLASNVDTTGNIIFSTTRVDGKNSGTYSNAGSAYAVVTGATSGTGVLTLLGPTSSNINETNTSGGGLIYLRGTLGHTGGMQAVGTTVFLGQQNPDYLSTINLNLSAGATLGANGANAYTVGSGTGQISLASSSSNGIGDAGGFSGVGGANIVTLNGGAALNFTSPNSNPYQFGAINLGSTLSTHEVTLTNELTATAQTVNISASGPQAARLTGNITGTANFALFGNSFGTLILAGTGNTYSGSLTVNNGYLLKIENASAFGADVAKTITVGTTGNLDLAGYSVGANRSWSVNGANSITPLGNILNSNTSTGSTVSGNISVSNSRADTTLLIGGPGDLTFEGWIRNNAASGSSPLVFGGSGNYTVKGDFDNLSVTTANTTVYGGTLIFDNSVFNTDGVTNIRSITTNATSSLTMTTATFRVLGNDTANTVQSVGGTGTRLNYINTIEVRSGTGAGQVTTLNLGALTRGSSATLNLIENNLGEGTAVLTTTTPNGNATILGGWVTYNGNTYAANDGANNVIGLTDYNTTGFSSTAVTDITAATSTTTSGTSAAMRFNDSDNRTLTIDGTLARSTAPMGILVTDNVNGDTLITGGAVSASEIAVHQYETSGTLTINSRLTAASVQIEKTGPGTLVLGDGTNNGNAQAAIGQGVLEVAVANALGSSTASTSIILTGNGTLRYTGSTDYQRGGGTGGEGRILLYGNGNIENNGTGKLIIASTQGLAVASYANVYLANLGLGGSGDIDVAGVQLGGTAIYEGYSKITKTGTGTVTLTEESLLQGGVDINAGTFAFSGNGSIQAWTPVNINGGTFDNKSANAKQGGNIDLNSGNITSTGGGAFTVQAINAAIASGTATVSADIQGQLASVTKTGEGTLILSGNNTYWQGTMLHAGTLAATRASSLGDSTGALTFGGNATLRADASFSSTRNTTLASGVTATFDTNGNALSEAGVISGAGALTKTGSGTLTLSAANTYTGGTTVSAGTLLLATTGEIASSSFINLGTSGSQGTLDVSAKTGFTIPLAQSLTGYGSVAVGAGKTLSVLGPLAPGNGVSPGVLSIGGNMALAGNTTLKINGITSAGVDYDKVTLSESLTNGGQLVFQFGNLLAAGSITLFEATSHTDSFSTVSGAGSYGDILFSLSENVWTASNGLLTFDQSTGVLTAVPEPAPWALLAIGVLGGLVLRRAKRRRRLAFN